MPKEGGRNRGAGGLHTVTACQRENIAQLVAHSNPTAPDGYSQLDEGRGERR